MKPYDLDIVNLLKKRREEIKKAQDSKDTFTPSGPQIEEKK